MPIITIDGNIGCCKTSILNYLHKNYKLPVDLEPVDNWEPYLAKMYENQDIFKFQVRVWLDRCWIQEKSDKTTILMERGPYFIKNVFIKTAHELKMISDTEYSILLDLHKKTESLWTSSSYIYLRSSPENCLKRIKKRNRPSEKNITLEYIEHIHRSHEESYNNALINKMNIICIEVDNKNIADIANEIMTYFHDHLVAN